MTCLSTSPVSDLAFSCVSACQMFSPLPLCCFVGSRRTSRPFPPLSLPFPPAVLMLPSWSTCCPGKEMLPLLNSTRTSIFNMGRAGGGNGWNSQIELRKPRRKEGNNSEWGVSDSGGLLASLWLHCFSIIQRWIEGFMHWRTKNCVFQPAGALYWLSWKLELSRKTVLFLPKLAPRYLWFSSGNHFVQVTMDCLFADWSLWNGKLSTWEK